MDYISGIESAFKTHIGDKSVKDLKKSITDKPMILIAGEQLTGKSTQAKRLADYLGGSFHSVGALFRDAAKKRGISVAEQAKLLLVERGIDVEIDYKTCQVISGFGMKSNLGVVEGRQPAYMGSYMASLGKENIIRLYLKCYGAHMLHAKSYGCMPSHASVREAPAEGPQLAPPPRLEGAAFRCSRRSVFLL